MGSIKQAIQAEKSKGFTIRFELRTTKKDKDGRAPIRLVYQVKNERKVYNTGQSVLPECWDLKNQETIYIDKKTAKRLHPAIDYNLFLTDTQAKEFNERLIDLITSIKRITDRLLMDKIVFNAEMVIDRLKANKTVTTK